MFSKMPFFSVLPCFAILPRNAENAVAESAPVVVTSAAFGMEDQSEDPIVLCAGNPELGCAVEQVPKPEHDSVVRKECECDEAALKVQLAELMEEKEIAVSANKQLAEIIDGMKLEAMEASTAREELTRQNIELQNELLRKESDLQTIEQEMKDVIFNRNNSSNKVGLMQMEIRNLKIRRKHDEERNCRLEKELADKEAQRKLEHANHRVQMEHAMAQHAKQLNDIESENKVLVQRMVQQHQLDMEEQRVQYEAAMAELHNRLENEHQARLHSALEEAKAQHEAKFSNARRRFLAQTQIQRTTANSHRMQAEQLATNLRECEGKLLEMETANRRLEEALHKQKETSNAYFEELCANHATIGRMRNFHAKLLENRDKRIEELQGRVKELEECPDKNVQVVGPDYYKLLGIERDAGTSEIKSAYYAQSRIHHPDKHRDSPDQKKHEAIFKTVKYGYEVLANSHSRRKYDKWLDMTSVRLAHQQIYC
ncbi:DJ-like protein subfamily C [Daphnia sinensis]|uniref:DJ-like protein subfamily C n=1 Tax=Daphnia sinensis TaxID=1820382 RepID=A0AAD5KPA0_9CRUS|nr:DJ-like protein subfamily C [Daphnia sinensis]